MEEERELPGDKGTLAVPKPNEKELSLHLNGSTSSRHTSFGTATYLSYDLDSLTSDKAHYKQPENENYLIYDRKLSTRSFGGHRNMALATRNTHWLIQKYATTRQFPSFYDPFASGLSHEPSKTSNTFGNTTPTHLRPYLSSSAPRYRSGANGFPELQQKESSFSFFDIETDKLSSYQYRPGEVISGNLQIFVKNSTSIRFLELIVKGRGVYSVRRSKDELPLKFNETFLHKKKCLIGSKTIGRNTLLPRGHIDTKFKIPLPKDLPSTLHYDDKFNGVTCDISYSIQARICDSSGYVKGNASHQLHRVLIFKQIHFNVQRSFDISSLSVSGSSVTHTEQLKLSRCHNESAVVTVHMERSVYLAGDEIRFQINVNLPNRHSVKATHFMLECHSGRKNEIFGKINAAYTRNFTKITCLFHEQITLGHKQEPVTITLSGVNTDNDDGKTASGNSGTSVFSFNLPTRLDLVSQFSLGSSQVKVVYILFIKLTFSPTKGKLTFKVPVLIGPCADPIYGEKTSSGKVVPIFNKPTRFSTFNRQLRGDQTFGQSFPAASLKPTTSDTAPDRIDAKYESGLVSCFMCCFPGKKSIHQRSATF